MAVRDDDMSFWRAGDRGAWREEDRRYDRPRSDAERRSFGTEGEREPWRRDRYGSRFDQDRADYGSGYDASRDDYGRGDHEFDRDYLHWREGQMRSHDRDYRDWRDAQHRQYDDEYRQFRTERRNHFGNHFHQWRAQRNLTGGMIATDIAPGMSGGYAEKTAHAGGFIADQDRPSGAYEPVSSSPSHAAEGRAAASTGSEFGKEPPEVQATTDGDRKVDRK